LDLEERYRSAVEDIFNLRFRCLKAGHRKIERLLGLLGNPERDLRIVRVVGTNGKGSVCAMLGSVLAEAGYRVGMNTSPHLVDFTERINVGGRPVSRDDVVKLYGRIAPIIESMEREPGMGCPTYFEVTTAMALMCFRDMGCDPVLLEAGIGGRSDATHVTEPMLVVITRIAMDHAEKLGGDIESIARDKADSIPYGGRCVTSSTGIPLDIIEEVRRERDAHLAAISHHDVEVIDTGLKGTRFSFAAPERTYEDVFIPLPGAFQAENAALAIMAAEELARQDYSISEEHIRAGLSGTRWPGRMQVIGRDPRIVVDCGHNPDAAERIAAGMSLFGDGRTILVMGICEEKDVQAVIGKIVPAADEVIFTRADNERAVDPDELRKRAGRDCRISDSLAEAIELARGMTGKDDIILVFGSVYLAGEALSFLGGSTG